MSIKKIIFVNKKCFSHIWKKTQFRFLIACLFFDQITKYMKRFGIWTTSQIVRKKSYQEKRSLVISILNRICESEISRSDIQIPRVSMINLISSLNYKIIIHFVVNNTIASFYNSKFPND